MRVLVCGGRNFSNYQFLFKILDRIHAKRSISTIIEGGARGADNLGRRWAMSRNIPVETFEADWDRYENRAGPVRNNQMLREGKPDLVVAFEGAIGTAHMVGISEKAGIPVLRTWKYKDTSLDLSLEV